jgi:hypothetical protein
MSEGRARGAMPPGAGDMSGGPTEPHRSDGSSPVPARRPPVHRPLLSAAIAVGLAAVAAAAATSAARLRDQPDAGPGATTAAAALAAPGATVPSRRRITHEFTSGYTGTVWMTVTVTGAPDGDVELTWGPWRRWFRPREPGPVTYWFEKKDAESVPLGVDVAAGVSVVFGEGPVPPGGIDARPGWSRRPPSAVEDPALEPTTTR